MGLIRALLWPKCKASLASQGAGPYVRFCWRSEFRLCRVRAPAA